MGQEAAARTLKNAIATDRVAHAYLFTGTRGVGKTTMARILAKALNCLNFDKPTTQPCCKCESCLAINEGEDIDVLEIDAASNTGVEHIRELRQNAIYRPARARFKIYIIDEVHMLSVSAFNALLKTLEEPPEHIKFILATTEPNKVLATIQSRCQRFNFRNIQTDEIAGQLQKILADEKVQAEEQLVRRVARLANGSMRDGLSLLDQLLSMAEDKLTVKLLVELLGTPRSEQIVALAEAIGQGDLGKVLAQADTTIEEGLALESLAQALQEHFRDLMVLRNCGADTELVEMDDSAVRQQMAEQARMFDDAALVYNITVMEELRRSIRSSGSGRALLEAAMVRLTASERFSDTKALLEQMHRQQGQSQNVRTAARPAERPRVASKRSDAADAGRTRSNAGATAGTAEKPKSASVSEKPEGLLESPNELNTAYLQENWNKILTELVGRGMKHLEAYLQPAQPTEWEKGVLKLGFGDNDGMGNFLKGQPSKVNEIEKALGEVLMRPIKISLTELPAKAAPAGDSKARPSPGAKPSQKEINKTMNDPQVKQVQQILGGKVRRVDRMVDDNE